MTAEPFTFFNEDYYLRFGWWLLCVPVIVWMLFGSPWILFRQMEGRKERAIARAKKIGRWLMIMIVLYVAQGVLDRAFARRDCAVGEEGRSPDGLYELEICFMAGRPQDGSFDTLARLRSAKDGTVLVEAEVHNPSISRVHWNYWGERHRVHVGAGDGSVNIALPPSWLDRLRAKVP